MTSPLAAAHAVAASAIGSTVGSDTVQAHGIGGQADLPIPLTLAISGAVAALVVSFTVLVVAWRRPRYELAGGRLDRTAAAGTASDPAIDPGLEVPRDDAQHEDAVLRRRAGRPAPAALDRVVGSRGFHLAARALGLALAVFTAVCAIAGSDDLNNPFFGIFYVWLWVGLIFASALLGPTWRAISPVRAINAAIARLADSDPDRGLLTYPERLGHWPAALGLFAFVWLELAYAYPTDLGPVRLWCAVYFAVMLVGGALFGNRFYELGDPFEVYSGLIAKLSPWARVDGRLVLRSPLANLATVVPRPGLVGVVAVLFGSTAFDSFRESSFWVRTYQNASVSKVLLDNIALVGFCLTAGVLLAIGSALTRGGGSVARRELPGRYAHSIVPIILGYILAHYLTLWVDVGTQTLARVSDPLSTGANLFGTAGLTPSYWFSYHPTLLATIKVLAVVVGHVVAAVAAHDRALALLPRREQIVGQLPMLLIMVAFTGGGLYLLFNA